MHKHTIRNIFVALILLVLIASVFLMLRNFRSIKQPGQTTGVIITTPQKITDASASIKYKIDVSYPSFSGLTDVTAEKAVNDAIVKQMQDGVTSFKQEVGTTEQGLVNAPEVFATAINEYYVTYTIARADDKIISVQFEIMDYQAGMDHPNNYNAVFNYDVTTKRMLTATDVFQANSDYLNILSSQSKTQLATRFKDNPYAGDFITTGTAPDTKNFSLFTLGTGTLNIIFDPYQVAPYYAGTQTVAIPYAALKSVFTPSFSY